MMVMEIEVVRIISILCTIVIRYEFWPVLNRSDI